MKVLGLDPALRVTGYGVVEARAQRLSLIEAGVIAPHPGNALEVRLRELHAAVTEIIAATRPDLLVIEELYTTYRNLQTAIMMGHARGVLALAGAQAGLPVRTLGHTRVKRALIGTGSARKEQVNAMVTHLLGLRRPPRPNDVSDALALAIAYLNVADHERRLAPVIALAKRSTA
jgi:crossover junction endodeoxyribonuclease RuvC